MLSRNGARDRARACGAGCTSNTPTTSARNDVAFSANDGAIPRCSTETAATAGPTARARFHVTEFSPTATPMSSRSTSEGISASAAGEAKAFAMPSPQASRMTTHVGASPAQVSKARPPARATETSWVTSRIRFRLKRSANAPLQGERTSRGTNSANVSTPSSRPEWVCRQTRSCAASVWNHQPVAESALPVK